MIGVVFREVAGEVEHSAIVLLFARLLREWQDAISGKCGGIAVLEGVVDEVVARAVSGSGTMNEAVQQGRLRLEAVETRVGGEVGGDVALFVG